MNLQAERDPGLASVHQLHLRRATRTNQTRRESLCADPAVTRELLLIGLVMDRQLEDADCVDYAELAWATGYTPTQLEQLLLRDIPRYAPPARPSSCQFRGPRGGQCRAAPSLCRELVDPEEGTLEWLAACRSPEHHDWAENVYAAHQDRLAGRVPPLPAYNTVSVLAPHFPEIDFVDDWVRLTTRYRAQDIYDAARDPELGGGACPRPAE